MLDVQGHRGGSILWIGRLVLWNRALVTTARECLVSFGYAKVMTVGCCCVVGLVWLIGLFCGTRTVAATVKGMPRK